MDINYGRNGVVVYLYQTQLDKDNNDHYLRFFSAIGETALEPLLNHQDEIGECYHVEYISVVTGVTP